MLASWELSVENIPSNKFMFHHAWRLWDHTRTSFYFCVNASFKLKVNTFFGFSTICFSQMIWACIELTCKCDTKVSQNSSFQIYSQNWVRKVLLKNNVFRFHRCVDEIWLKFVFIWNVNHSPCQIVKVCKQFKSLPVASIQTFSDVIHDITKRMKIFFTNLTNRKHIEYKIMLYKIAIE